MTQLREKTEFIYIIEVFCDVTVSLDQQVHIF